MEDEQNPADSLIAAYERADGLAAWCVEMVQRCGLTKGRSVAQLIAFAHADTFGRQFEYALYFPHSTWRPQVPHFPDSI